MKAINSDALDLDKLAKLVLLQQTVHTVSKRPSDLMPRWIVHSRPWLLAIANKNYGLEDPAMCVLYALDNLTGWRGPIAKRLKTEINLLLDAARI